MHCRYPQYAVSKWIGHSITISGKHYANAIPEERYERVTEAVQNAAHQLTESDGKQVKVSAVTVGGDAPNAAKTLAIPLVAASCQMGDEGLEHVFIRCVAQWTYDTAFYRAVQNPVQCDRG